MNEKFLKKWKNELELALLIGSRQYEYISDVYDLLNLVDSLIEEKDELHFIKSRKLFGNLSKHAMTHVPKFIREELEPKGSGVLWHK